MDDAPAAPPVLEGQVLSREERLEQKPWQFKKGDPRICRDGRKHGSKNILGESFVRDLAKWHAKHGMKAIERVGREDPAKLLSIIAQMVPKETNLDVSVRGGLVLGSVELSEVERRTHELLRRIEDSGYTPVGPD